MTGMDDTRPIVPDDPGIVPSPEEPDPARDVDGRLEGVDRGGTGAPVGADNIRQGRVTGTMVTPGSTQGQGEGG